MKLKIADILGTTKDHPGFDLEEDEHLLTLKRNGKIIMTCSTQISKELLREALLLALDREMDSIA